ncbi:TPA: hypothetical protein ENX78_02995 [Candidatus Poribacteria bacterium]|nr:hypothetical protein [Candidatus Poribacteria bacterium]
MKSIKSEGDLNIEKVRISLDNAVEELERKLISDALRQSDGNQTKAAKYLGISERNLRYKLKKYNMK